MIETKILLPELCECGRSYKDRINKEGNSICVLCHTGFSLDDLKILWGTKVPQEIIDYYTGKK